VVPGLADPDLRPSLPVVRRLLRHERRVGLDPEVPVRVFDAWVVDIKLLADLAQRAVVEQHVLDRYAYFTAVVISAMN